MNDAELMASAYALYSQNLAAFSAVEKVNLIGQIQSYFNSPPQVSGSTAAKSERVGAMENGRDSLGEDGIRPACRFCGKTFAQASYIKAHERLHTGEKPYCCSVCGKPFSDASNWKKHERMHSRQIQSAIEEGVLPLVNTASSTSELSAMHLCTSPPIMSKPQLISEDLSLIPRRIKTDPMSLICRTCGKVFSTPASLSMHRKIHSGERPHSCGTCGKSFTQIGTLRAHERVHTGEKPYECKFCGKTFAQCGSYRMHERRHRRDMLDSWQKCYVCAASFDNLEELQKHMATHPGAVPHSPSLTGFPTQVPLNYSLSQDQLSDEDSSEPQQDGLDQDTSSSIERYHTPPNSAPALSFTNDHFQLPPFASAAHSLIHRSLSQGSNPHSTSALLFQANSTTNSNVPTHHSTNNISMASDFSLASSPFSFGLSNPCGPPLYLPSNGIGRDSPPASNQMIHQQAAAQTSPSYTPPPLPPPLISTDVGQEPLTVAVKTESVEEVSTTTRSRKYSSDSHTSVSLLDGQLLDRPAAHFDITKATNADDIDGANCNQNHKAMSEESSLAESHSNEDFQSDDQHCGISRQNLNRRLISSSNPRKQRHPMRRLSASGSIGVSMDADTSDGMATMAARADVHEDNEDSMDGDIPDEMMEKISRDQMLVSFLLSRGRVYKCEHCRIIFEDCTLYLLHNGFHSNDSEPFKCVICKKLCSDRVEFNCHLTSHVK